MPKGIFKSDKITPFLFLAPALILFLSLSIYPTYYSLKLSFFEWDGLSPQMKFIGFSNYFKMFSDPILKIAVFNTIYFVVFTVVFQSSLALFLAVVVESVPYRALRTFFRTSYFFPAIISTVVVALIWGWMYHPYFGALNNLLKNIGILSRGERDVILWLQQDKTLLPSIFGANLWQWTGFNMIIFAAGLQSIPEELFESAKIDGANVWQQFIYITLPSLRLVIAIVIITTMINGLKVFDLFYVLTDGGPAHKSEVIGTWLYRKAFKHDEMGYGAAIGYSLALVSFIFTYIYLKRLRRGESEK